MKKFFLLYFLLMLFAQHLDAQRNSISIFAGPNTYRLFTDQLLKYDRSPAGYVLGLDAGQMIFRDFKPKENAEFDMVSLQLEMGARYSF